MSNQNRRDDESNNENKRMPDAENGRGNRTVPIEQIMSAVRSIRYGYVQITVQDSKVVQIDKTEKIRLDRKTRADPENGGE